MSPGSRTQVGLGEEPVTSVHSRLALPFYTRRGILSIGKCAARIGRVPNRDTLLNLRNQHGIQGVCYAH